MVDPEEAGDGKSQNRRHEQYLCIWKGKIVNGKSPSGLTGAAWGMADSLSNPAAFDFVYSYTYDGTVDNGSTRLTRTYRGPSQSERSNVITKLLSSIDCWIHLPFPTLTTYDALNIEQ